ncbi:MAG: PilZ domain-containing protein [Nitrospiraceae bacterium]
MPTPKCPRCGTLKVRPAPRRSLSDRAFAFLTVHPFRCQLCARRFRSLIGKRAANPGRAYDRLSVKYPVWFQLSALPTERLTFQGMIENLSIRGCRIRTNKAFPVGTRVRLEFLSSHQSFPITIDGAIVRSRRDNVIGLRFIAILHAEERRIGHILNLRLPDLEPT